MKRTSRKWIQCLALLAVFPLISGPTCGSKKSTEEGEEAEEGADCPGAPTLYKYARDLHKETLLKLRFNATWEVTVEDSLRQDAKFTKNGTCALVKAANCEDTYDGSKEWGSRIVYSFTMPPAPQPLTCAHVVETQEMMPSLEIAKQFILSDYSTRVVDALGPMLSGDEIILGSGTSWAYEESSWTSHRWAMGGLCQVKNPCKQQRDESGDCPRTEAEMTATAYLTVSWSPEDDAMLNIDVYDEQGSAEQPSRSSVKIDDGEDIEYKYSAPTDPENIPEQICSGATATCLGETRNEQQCSGRFYAATMKEKVVLTHTTYTYDLSSEGGDFSRPEIGSKSITLRCTKGCDCISDAQCDDANACTRDSCNAGNCVNAPDDKVELKQASLHDCKEQVCKNGRPTNVNADIEVPLDEKPDDCTYEVCKDGVPTEQFDDSKPGCQCQQDLDCEDGNICTKETCDQATHKCVNHGPDDTAQPPEIPANCNMEECKGGKVVLVPNDGDMPPDPVPADCRDDYCDNGVIKSGADDNDMPPDIPGDCQDLYCENGVIKSGAWDDDMPPEVPYNCKEEYCEGGKIKTANDDNDKPLDTNPTDCLQPVCVNGTATTAPDPTECQ